MLGEYMNLSQLYYFRKLAELEHYTQAARELYISQPALSEAIHALEQELKIPLFQKEGRNVKLTKYGYEFNEYIKRGLQEIDNGIERAKSYTSSIAGTLKIGAIFTVQGDYLPCLLNAFATQVSPHVNFELRQGFSLPLIEGLRKGEYDAVFAAKPAEAYDLECIEVVAHELVAAVRTDHPLSRGGAVDFFA